MADIDQTLKAAMLIDGAVSVAIANYRDGLEIASLGEEEDVELSLLGNAEMVYSQVQVIKALDVQDQVEDMFISLGHQYHLIRLLPLYDLFIYIVLDRNKTNLALARHRFTEVASALEI